MTSAIDITKPVPGIPTTQSVRDNFAVAAGEITALQDAGTVPEDGYPYQRFGSAWTRLAALFPAMFGAVPGAPDATSALQAGLDAACNLGLDFIIDAAYLTSGVVVYSGSTMRFVPGGALKFTGAGSACIATSSGPGAGPPSGSTIVALAILKPVIDMQGNSGSAIVLDDCAWALVDQPTVLNTGGASWTYNSSQGPSSIPDGAVAFHATNTAAQAYYSKIVLPHFINTAAGGNQGCGVYAGCPTGAVAGFPNYNAVEGGMIRGFANGAQIDAGSDCIFDSVDVSKNTTGYLIGNGSHVVHRTRIIKPYAENCTIGIHTAVNADRTFVEGAGSFSGTVTPILEDPGNTHLATQYVNVDTPTGPAQLFPQNPLGGAGLWSVASGAGGFAGETCGIAHFSYDSGWGGLLLLAHIGGTPAAKTAITNNLVLGQVVGAGWDGTALSGNSDANAGADIMFQAAEDWSAAAHGSRVVIHVCAPGTIGPRIAEVQIASSGSRFTHGIGAWNQVPPATQPNATGNVHTVAAGSGTAVFTNTTFDGGQGTVAYTLGDIVKALKQSGLIAN